MTFHWTPCTKGLIPFWGKLWVFGMVLMGFLGLLTRSMEDHCLALSVAKDWSLPRRLEYSSWSVLKSTTLSFKRYESSFLFGLFMIFPWVLSLLIPSWKCSLLVFSKSTFLSVRYESVRIDVFMLFVQIISNNKNTAYKNCKFGICNGSCCHSNCFEIIT